MPLLTVNDLKNSSPFFRGALGERIANNLFDIFYVRQVNELYDKNKSLKGVSFTSAILKDLDVCYEVKNVEVMEELTDRAFITISNHPYGGLDGLILIDFLGNFRQDYKVMVNKILGKIESLNDKFINVIPTGPKRLNPEFDSIKGIRKLIEHVSAGHPMGLFPSGAISDFNIIKFRVEDRAWQEPLIRLMKKIHVPILPIKFLGGNSAFFYSLGLIHWKLRLLKLPSELFNKKGKNIKVILGNIITPEQQDNYPDLKRYGEYLRNSVYKLI